jgi:hypothetical protein
MNKIKNTIPFWIAIFATVLFVNLSFGQVEYPEDKVSWKFSLTQEGDVATVIAKISIVDHWHINAVKLPEGSFGYPTSLEIKKSTKYKSIGGVIEPKPIEKFDEMADEQLAYHEGTFLLKRKVKILSEDDFTIEGSFSFQTCNEVRCLKDHTVDFKLKAKGYSKEEVKVEEGIESTFVDVKNDVAKNKEGDSFVKVNNEWFKVPSGNSPDFYKKYITITKNEK